MLSQALFRKIKKSEKKVGKSFFAQLFELQLNLRLCRPLLSGVRPFMSATIFGDFTFQIHITYNLGAASIPTMTFDLR